MTDYTPPHESRSDRKKHATYKGNEFTVHAYDDTEEPKPWPMGNEDKWFSKKQKGKKE